MLFNSLEFLLFLPIVFILYWFIFNNNLKRQNLLIVVASYIFYGWWDWRFLFLIFASSLIDFVIGNKLESTYHPTSRKTLLWISICVNLGLLGIFKYYNFFMQSLQDAFHSFGAEISLTTLHIVLPVGISFYTFQTLSYTIDVYKGKLKPTHDPIKFFAFVSFFPQLVAGPIERATNLLGQFDQPRVFSYTDAKDGVRQIVWGFFKKIVIADTCAVFVNQIFDNYTEQSSGMLLLGAFYFAFQIYGDFSGYSDIAIGTAKLFGFRLMTNFRYPYFSRDMAEFWRRWHISLSTWFRDYLYIPLGGSRGGKKIAVRNTFIIFIVSGFWHGANWTFIVWGALNAIYFLPLLLANRNRKNLDTVAEGRQFVTFQEFFKLSVTFALTLIAWVFFRAPSVNDAWHYLTLIVTQGAWNVDIPFLTSVPLILLLIIIEWIQRLKEHPMEIGHLHPYSRFASYCVLIFLIVAHISNTNQEFIYFQF
uniref:MBOAT family O-acyltransferase n=1 Tax=Roseihalotalea indica TaxID=2867963 RepID=A0AA49GMW0_9BACT|nr:MBOAT family O-acyltransferase [Tunicatimonas sp. TK19036]